MRRRLGPAVAHAGMKPSAFPGRFGVVRALFVGVVLTLFALTPMSALDHWPQFRGREAGVVADDPALPEIWGETENVVWKTNIPGLGWSSPVVWENHIFLTSALSSGAEPA